MSASANTWSTGIAASCGRTSRGARILNDPTLKLLARAAASHAEAGADIVAPSDMMDGRVRAIRAELDRLGFAGHAHHVLRGQVCLGVLRAVPRSGRIRARSSATGAVTRWTRPTRTKRCAKWRWISQEGADIVMVKPALAYLDILHRVKTEFGYPTAAYAVSGEYSMVKAAAAKGWIDERAVTLESLLAMRRAGADILITYARAEVARLAARSRSDGSACRSRFGLAAIAGAPANNDQTPTTIATIRKSGCPCCPS